MRRRPERCYIWVDNRSTICFWKSRPLYATLLSNLIWIQLLHYMMEIFTLPPPVKPSEGDGCFPLVWNCKLISLRARSNVISSVRVDLIHGLPLPTLWWWSARGLWKSSGIKVQLGSRSRVFRHFIFHAAFFVKLLISVQRLIVYIYSTDWINMWGALAGW